MFLNQYLNLAPLSRQKGVRCISLQYLSKILTSVRDLISNHLLWGSFSYQFQHGLGALIFSKIINEGNENVFKPIFKFGSLVKTKRREMYFSLIPF